MANGLFVGNSGSFFENDISKLNVNSQEFMEFIVSLQQRINNLTNAINMKSTGSFTLSEFVTGNTYFPNPSYSSSSSITPAERPEYRMVVNFGALPNTTTKSVAHGITCNSSTIFTDMWAISSDTSSYNYIKIPYASSTSADIIELYVDGTNVNIKTGKDRSSYDNTIVVLSYLKG